MVLQYVALTPFASAELERNNISHKTVLEYPGKNERYDEGLLNFPRINAIIDTLDCELVQIHKIPTIKPAQYPFYYLKNLFDIFSSTTHLLNVILDIEKPDVVICCSAETDPERQGLFAYSDNDSIFADVLALMNKSRPFDLILIPQHPIRKQDATRARQEDVSLRERIIRYIRDNEYQTVFSFGYNIGLVRKKFGTPLSLKTMFWHILPRAHQPVLIYEYGYDWDDMLPQIVEAGLHPVIRLSDYSINHLVNDYHLDKPEDISEHAVKQQIQRILSEDVSYREQMIFGTMDLSSLMIPKMAAIIAKSVRDSVHAYRSFSLLHHKTPFRAVFLSVHTHSKSFSVVQAAHDAGALVISWQHGGAGYTYQPLMPYVELYNSDYHFVYGDAVKKSYLDTVRRSGFRRKIPEIISVGSTSFDKMRENAPPPAKGSDKIKSVLYVTSNYYRNGYYISQPTYPIEYDVHLWKIQRRILELARENPECIFTIKLHPTHKDGEPLRNYANRHGITNVRFVVGEKELVELVQSADITLFDLVSTGILQAMTVNKPLFVYGGAFRIGEEALHLLTRRAYYADTPEEFISCVNNYIKCSNNPKFSQNTPVNCNDQEFLKAYGIQSDDGKSADRALKIIRKLIKP